MSFSISFYRSYRLPLPFFRYYSGHYVSRNSGDFFVSKLMLACPRCIHFKLSNLPDVVAHFSRGDVNMPNCNAFPNDDLVSEVKFEATVYELCDRMPVSWLLAPSTTVSRYSMYLSDLMFLMILLVVGCSCLKSQRERIIYGMNSAPKRRYVHIRSLIGYSNLLFSSLFLLRKPIFVHHFSISISRSNSAQIGFFNDSSNKSPSRFPFPLLPHANFVLLFLYPKLK